LPKIGFICTSIVTPICRNQNYDFSIHTGVMILESA
jgi:hypothetical protein